MDPKTYEQLLLLYIPRPIADDAEHDRQLAIISKLLARGDAITPEEDALLEVFSMLVVDYEEFRYPIEPPSPVEMLRCFMEDHGLKQKDLVPVLGSSGRVSEILSGKREITLGQAKRLAGRFGVGAELFMLLK